MYHVCRYLVHRVWLCCSEAGTVTQKLQTYLPEALIHCHLFISMHFQIKTKGFSYLISYISDSTLVLSINKKPKMFIFIIFSLHFYISSSSRRVPIYTHTLWLTTVTLYIYMYALSTLFCDCRGVQVATEIFKSLLLR